LHRPPFLPLKIKHLEEILSVFLRLKVVVPHLKGQRRAVDGNYDAMLAIGLLVLISSSKSDIASLEVAV
jgi:hypothetical protein